MMKANGVCVVGVGSRQNRVILLIKVTIIGIIIDYYNAKKYIYKKYILYLVGKTMERLRRRLMKLGGVRGRGARSIKSLLMILTIKYVDDDDEE